MFAFNALPAIAIKSLESETPTFRAPSSSWYTQLNAVSSAPQWVRTVWRSLYFARRLSADLFDKSDAAPPTRNKQLGISIDFLFPKYQF
ncbi:hypothetical protein HanRHA438_Chr03g0120951 [Helianthus annuus]|nr:hypothetical protein HanIR_Chr03g0120191 [Helianthus annuus]KAJ0935555.1 hypothetical protein HanRHA438_Chr03g0120951 [Helianthus annuus]